MAKPGLQSCGWPGSAMAPDMQNTEVIKGKWGWVWTVLSDLRLSPRDYNLGWGTARSFLSGCHEKTHLRTRAVWSTSVLCMSFTEKASNGRQGICDSSCGSWDRSHVFKRQMGSKAEGIISTVFLFLVLSYLWLIQTTAHIYGRSSSRNTAGQSVAWTFVVCVGDINVFCSYPSEVYKVWSAAILLCCRAPEVIPHHTVCLGMAAMLSSFPPVPCFLLASV